MVRQDIFSAAPPHCLQVLPAAFWTAAPQRRQWRRCPPAEWRCRSPRRRPVIAGLNSKQDRFGGHHIVHELIGAHAETEGGWRCRPHRAHRIGPAGQASHPARLRAASPPVPPGAGPSPFAPGLLPPAPGPPKTSLILSPRSFSPASRKLSSALATPCAPV